MGLDINIVVFDGFEPLDVFGPFEVFINTDSARVRLFSLVGPGVLDGRRATSNDLAFDWVVGTGGRVDWIKDARWVADGKFRTSSGISAGIDMALAFVEDTCGPEAADRASRQMEYIRNRDSGYDPFA